MLHIIFHILYIKHYFFKSDILYVICSILYITYHIVLYIYVYTCVHIYIYILIV